MILESKSVYIHIPFCKTICSYCDFCKVFYQKKWVDEYLKSLKYEIEDMYNKEEIETFYIGGGTPSSLSICDLKKLFEIMKIFKTSHLKEFTFECNLDDITKELLILLKANRVDRLSIGIQSFQQSKLKQMGRNHTYKEAKEKIELCRECGFFNINIDFIYGFASETKKSVKKDLKKILSLKPDHISTYSLILEEGTILYLKNIQRMSEDLDSEIYKEIRKLLKKKRYIHYEISNFSLKGKESIHNKRYWENKEYYGFGVSASGYVSKMRYTNTKSLTKYLKNEYSGEKELLTKQDIMDNHLMLGFRLVKGFNIHEFENVYQVKLEEIYPIKPLLKNGELKIKKGNIFINSDKLYIMNEILIKMI